MNERILIVDDEQIVLHMLNKAFNKVGYEVFCAESAADALDVLLREEIQVMFVDLKMPETDGLELCRKIRDKYPIACVFAITGYSSFFELANCRKAGFDDYFTKPFDLDLLFDAIRDAFAKLDRWRIG